MARVRAFIFLAVPFCALAQAPTSAPLPASPLVWELRDGTHPKLGAIKVAVPSTSVATVIGKEKILSLVFFSCEKSRGRIAIELANAAESDARGGLYPKQMPKLFCNPRSSAPRVELAANWFVSEIGDAIARGFAPSDLRRCASIDVVQDIALPRGWGPESQRVDIELIPYKRELDAVLASCVDAEVLARAQSPAPTPAPAKASPAPAPAKVLPPPASATAKPAAPVAAPPEVASASPPAAPPAPAAQPPWRAARTLSPGRTNVRAGPGLEAPIVTMLDPNVPILVQETGGEWFRVKPASGNAFSGYVRRDRLLLP